MAPTLSAATPALVFNDTAGTTSLVTASFTPANGDILVVKATNGDANQTFGTPSGGSLTYTSRVNVGTSGSSTRTAIWTAPVTTGAAMTVTLTFTNSRARMMRVEVWTGALLAASPATHSVVGGSGAPTDSITTAANGSVVTWINGDWAAVDGTSRAYRSAATESAYHLATGGYTGYCAYQTAATAGAQTYGLTLPIGETYTMGALELQAAAGGPAAPPDVVIAQMAGGY